VRNHWFIIIEGYQDIAKKYNRQNNMNQKFDLNITNTHLFRLLEH